jgi:PEP-CTERM motif
VYLDGLFVEVKPGTSSTKSITVTGQVKTDAAKFAIAPGFNAVGSVFPVGSTLTSSGLQTQLASGGSAASSDLVWVPTSPGVFDRYYYRTPLSGAPSWRKLTTPEATVDGATVTLPEAVFIERKGTVGKSILVTPPSSYSITGRNQFMKYIFNTLILAAVVSAEARSATVDTANYQSVQDITAISYNSGTPSSPMTASGGIASFGYFNNLTDAMVVTMAADLGNITALINDFVSVGSSLIDSDFAGLGIYSGSFSPTLPNGTKAGKFLYSFLGDADTLQASDEWLLWQHTAVIDAQDTVTSPDSNSLLLGIEGMALISDGTFITQIDLDGSGDDPSIEVSAIRMATAVPEPSTLMLGAIGVLALLRRKR